MDDLGIRLFQETSIYLPETLFTLWFTNLALINQFSIPLKIPIFSGLDRHFPSFGRC